MVKVSRKYHIRKKGVGKGKVRRNPQNKCYRCGGTTKFYDGALGYEAMVCQKCGHHYAETSKEEYERNKAEYKKSKKSNYNALLKRKMDLEIAIEKSTSPEFIEKAQMEKCRIDQRLR